VFGLKEAVGTDVIRAHEEDYLRRAIDAWRPTPTIEVLGNVDAERLSIVSFVVRRPDGTYLHHNAVVALLNDLFGIQARGGCSCAGPYGHTLLGIDVERSHSYEREIAQGCEGIKPGWVRSTSTTSSPSRSSPSSSRRWRSSPGTGTCSSPTTTSTPRRASGGTGTARWSRRYG
jgi:hypothetical protein